MRTARLSGVAFGWMLCASLASADVLLLATQGLKFYRIRYDGASAQTQEYDLPFGLIGMTRVPVGSHIFGGNSGGIIAVQDQSANQAVYRVTGVATGGPSVVLIGRLTDPTWSPVFVGARLFGIGEQSNTVCIREYNTSTGATLHTWLTGVPAGSGGLAYHQPDESLYFITTQALWKVRIADLGQPATQVGGNFPIALNKNGLDAFGPVERPTLFLAAQTAANNPGSFFVAEADWDTGVIEQPHIADLARRLDTAVVSAAAIPCGADFNEDGFIDFFDFSEYVDCFTGTCPPGKDADISEDGFVDYFDFQAFVTAFESGC